MAQHSKEEFDEEERGMPLVLDLLLTCLITIALVVFMRTFVVDSYIIPSGSMLETIQIDSLLFGEKVSYRFRAPNAGEIVTFDDPEGDDVTIIKRVIATEGQTVDLIDGSVVVDGVALEEPYTLGKPSEPLDRYSKNLDGPISFPYTVPAGHVWVMGDNRTNSLDSRYFGPIDVSTISSHAVLIYWPFSEFKTL